MSSATVGGTTRVRRESMARVVPLSSAVICIESIPAYAGMVVPGLPFLMYVWLSCRAVVLANILLNIFLNWREA